MLTSDITKRLDSNDPDWKHLKVHIEDHISSLNRNDDIDFTDKEKAAILCLGRQEAVRILKEILEPFGAPAEVIPNGAKHTSAKAGML